ncbi:MAG: CorA family divalent cation transporter [Candidatus Bathyarchaeia archaeon]
MIKVYSVKANKVKSTEITSFKELDALAKKSDWLWIDCLEPNQKEYELIAQLLNAESDVMEEIKSGKPILTYKRFNDWILLSISAATIKEELETYQIYVAIKGKALLTFSSKDSASPVEKAISKINDCISTTECVTELDGIDPSFALCEVFREVVNKNLESIMSLRENVEKIEGEAFEKPAKKAITKKVFAVKKQISAFHRLLWSEREMITSLRDGLIPNIKLCQKSILSLEYAISSLSQELAFIDSIDKALDGILRLQDLGMIHRVESMIVNLTLAVVILTLILIILELW